MTATFTPRPGQFEGGAASHDARTDDDHVESFGHCADSLPFWICGGSMAFLQSNSDGSHSTMTSPQTFRITGMDCADCARSIERGVQRLAGVDEAMLNFSLGTLKVSGEVAAETIVAHVRELGYDVADEAAAPPGEQDGGGRKSGASAVSCAICWLAAIPPWP